MQRIVVPFACIKLVHHKSRSYCRGIRTNVEAAKPEVGYYGGAVADRTCKRFHFWFPLVLFLRLGMFVSNRR